MDNMSKPVKILIGLLTIWPPIWMAIFFVSMFGTAFLSASHSGHGNDPFGGVWFIALMIPHMITCILMSGLMIFYIVHVIMTTRIAENKTKAIWGAVLYLFNMLAMVVYWYLYIWPEPKSPDEPTQINV